MLLMAILLGGGCLLGAVPLARTCIADEATASSAEEHSLRLRSRPEVRAIERVLQVTDGIYSGAEPQGDAAFAALRKLGVETIVCVDSSEPQLEMAARHGLRYVHIPIGYDRISRKASLSVIHLLQQTKAPIFFHCHHGRQRGPAMAAIAAIGEGSATPRQALRVLETAGTSKIYPGLWRDVKNFRMPAKRENLPRLVERSQVDDVADLMAKLDRIVERLKSAEKQGFRAQQPDSDQTPLLDAKRVQRHFQTLESRRKASLRAQNAPAGSLAASAFYKDWLAAAEQASVELHDALEMKRTPQASRALAKVLTSCRKCHDRFRNQ